LYTLTGLDALLMPKSCLVEALYVKFASTFVPSDLTFQVV